MLNDLSRSEARRRRMIEDLRFRMEGDDIRTPTKPTAPFPLSLLENLSDMIGDDILEEARNLQSTTSNPLTPAHFEDYFIKRLETYYAENRNDLRLDQRESVKCCSRLREANAAFVKLRRTENPTSYPPGVQTASGLRTKARSVAGLRLFRPLEG